MEQIRQQRMATVYSDAWKSRLKKFVSRKFQNFGDWEGWFEEAHQNLALKIDRLPIERDLDDAIIYAIFKNELITVKRNRLGYPRPRQWLREFSELGQDLFEWMCLQKLNRVQTVELAIKKQQDHVYKSHGSEEPKVFRQLLDRLTETMMIKRECDGVRPEIDQIDGESAPEIATTDPSTENYSEQEQLRLVLSLILGMDHTDDIVVGKASSRLASMRAALAGEDLLTDIDILVLRCCYFQGMSQNEVAKLVQQPLQKVVRRREAAIKKIKEFLENHGFDRQSLM